MTIEQVKAHLRVDHDDEDTLLAAYLDAARGHIETVTRYQLVTATYRLDLPAFPAVLRLPRPPLQSVTSLVYHDGSDTEQTLPDTDYKVATSVIPAYIEPVAGWPAITEGPAAVQVTFVAGFGDQTAIPAVYQALLFLLIADMYEHREAEVEMARITENKTYQRLLQAARLLEV